jgi:hypothetical protein
LPFSLITAAIRPCEDTLSLQAPAIKLALITAAIRPGKYSLTLVVMLRPVYSISILFVGSLYQHKMLKELLP